MLRAALVTGTAVTAAYFVYRRSKKNDHPGVELPALSATVEKPEPVVPPPPPVAAAPAPESRRGLHILHSGDFAAETADMICQKLTAANVGPRPVRIRTMDDFKKWSTEVMLTDGDKAWPALIVVLVVATIENEQPPEAAGTCIRFFNRRTHPDDLLQQRMQYAVLGLGDSNLLLDRQTTSAKDCNQVARRLDSRLASLGAMRIHATGETDDRTGNKELEPWITSLADAIGRS